MKNTFQQVPASKKSKKQRVIRALLLVAGTISLAFGAIGIVLPILPTTPFLLLSAACYLRSSERMHKWLLGNRWFGEYIRNYQEGRGIPLKTKIVAMAFLWITIIFSAFFVLDKILIAQVALLLIALGVSVHLIRLPTLKK
ncbi:MAG: YbaN family protein [Chloroflexi bacterium]|nr:YbaN family protein [Chloroflexota bacterium]MCL5949655.1 YbaN family protein [Candidatus Bathyarchaeota archaeon]